MQNTIVIRNTRLWVKSKIDAFYYHVTTCHTHAYNYVLFIQSIY